LQQQVTDKSALVPLSGTAFYPPVWRGRFGLTWSYHPLSASVFVNHTGGSREVSAPGQLPIPAQRIASWTTLDGQVGMSFNGSRKWGDTSLILSVQNMLNRDPPLVSGLPPNVAAVNYDSTNTSPIGQFFTLQLTQTW
jgi:iron complex outermembrane receptor protein